MHRYYFVVLCSTIATLLLTVATAGTQGPPLAAAVRDSAGVRIVENTAPRWQKGEGWHLSSKPVLDLGGQEGPEYMLFGVVSAFRLEDGRVAIANTGANDIRIFDDHGRHLLTVGGTGSGPGEFKQLMWSGRYRGDSLAAYQFAPTYLTVFDKHGKYQRETHPAPISGRLVGVAQDGTLFAIIPTIKRLMFPEGVIRDSVMLLRAGATQPLWDSIGTYAGNDILYLRTGSRVTVAIPLFPRQTDILVHGDHFYVTSNYAYDIRKHRLDGGLAMVIRRNVRPLPVRQRHVESLLTDVLARYSDPNIRRAIERAMRETMPATLPVLGPRSSERAIAVLSAIRVDALGNLWVQEYRVPGDDVLPRWSVFDPEGVFLGQVALPSGFAPLDIGPDYVLGLWRNADDVEHVRMYDLVKP